MSRFWHVVAYEYRRHALQRRFLVVLLSLPAMIGFIIALGYVLATVLVDERPVGYIDEAGVLVKPAPPPRPDEFGQVTFIAYADTAEARAALESGTIQAFYRLPPNFRETSQAQLYYTERALRDSAREQFDAWLRAGLLSDRAPDVRARATDGTSFVIRMDDGTLQPIEASLFRLAMPALGGLALVITLFSTSGYLMQALIEEKENRTIEVLLTSLSAGQLIAGKVVGITAVGLTQIGTWAIFALLGVLIGRETFGWLRYITVEPTTWLLLLVVMLPAYVMVGALMLAVGATVTQASEGQQVTGLFSLPLVVPYWLAAAIISSPDSPLAVGMSLFPLTAPVTLSLRAGATLIPPWQMAVASAGLLLSAAVAVWLAGRAVRLGLLRYGQRLSWRELLRRG